MLDTTGRFSFFIMYTFVSFLQTISEHLFILRKFINKLSFCGNVVSNEGKSLINDLVFSKRFSVPRVGVDLFAERMLSELIQGNSEWGYDMNEIGCLINQEGLSTFFSWEEIIAKGKLGNGLHKNNTLSLLFEIVEYKTYLIFIIFKVLNQLQNEHANWIGQHQVDFPSI